MILCSQQPGPILKAVLLAQLHGDIPCLKGEESSIGLFSHTESLDADPATLPFLLSRLASRRIQADWLQSSPGKNLSGLIAANLRYRSPDRGPVIFAAVEEAIRYGHAYCFNGIGKAGRLFIARYRTVAHEVHRMLGFIRFHPGQKNTLICQPKLFHQTADLILKKFAPRYPETRLVLLLPEHALVLENGKLFSERPEDYQAYVLNDPFSGIWEKYYRSQYIATRKNISLASKCLPQKYWEWIDEGLILKEESQ